jgi:hypothetical protein
MKITYTVFIEQPEERIELGKSKDRHEKDTELGLGETEYEDGILAGDDDTSSKRVDQMCHNLE